MQPYLKSTLLACSLAAGQFLKAHAEFAPILIKTNSYNCDIVVEKRSPPPAVIVTTASMDQGTANAGFTWFERGYLPEWPSTGIPEAGTLLPSDRSPDHVYRMPPTYHGPNAFLVDSTCSNAVITFKTPTNCAVLSFLTSSGVARTILGYEIRHTDGTFESGTFTSPNWYSDGDPAWSSNGRANVQTFTRSDLNTYNPRLYSVDVSVSDNFTEIAGIGLSWVSGKGHAAILSISCAPKKGDAFIPVAVSGYTHDIVVEADAVKPGAIETNTTATMEGGTNDFGFTWYERGYNPAAADSGLPAPGSVVVSENDPAHRFQLPPSYEQPDAVVLDRSGTEANIFFETPAKYSAVSFLTAASAGAPAIRCVIRHADGFTETNSFVSSDWL
ncbi:MAG TPA: hypothetical protein VKY92_10325, partial [Verrucomicrobiae bacterium]|nr:hypothetical protein [Verrucomicrobiae bacterium]